MTAPMSLEQTLQMAQEAQTQTSVAPSTVNVNVVSAHDEVEIADFSFNPPPIKFTMDGDLFECHPVIPIASMQKLMKATKSMTDLGKQDVETAIEDTIQRLAQVFEAIMLPESAKRFTARLLGQEGRPLDLRHQVMPALRWVMERYGLRPTMQSSDSLSGSPDETDGTSSTAGASSGALTPQNSDQLNS